MEKAQMFFAAELTMRLSWRNGFHFCMWPCGNDRCYELLWPETASSEDRDYYRGIPLCATHKAAWKQLTRHLPVDLTTRVIPVKDEHQH